MKFSGRDKLVFAVGGLLILTSVGLVIRRAFTKPVEPVALPVAAPVQVANAVQVRGPELPVPPEPRQPIKLTRPKPVLTTTCRLPPLPEDCVLAARIGYDQELFRRIGELLFALDGTSDGMCLKRRLGRLLSNPELNGVDLSNPVYCFLLDPKKHSNPWVYQFSVADRQRLLAALRAQPVERGPAGGAYRLTDTSDAPTGAPGVLIIEGDEATLHRDACAAGKVMAWKRHNPEGPAFRLLAALRARVNVQALGPRPADELDGILPGIRDWMPQAAPEINRVLAGLSQIREVEFGSRLDATHAKLVLSVEPVESSELAEALQTSPGDVESRAADMLACLIEHASRRWAGIDLLRQVLSAAAGGFTLNVDQPNSELIMLSANVPLRPHAEGLVKHGEKHRLFPASDSSEKPPEPDPALEEDGIRI